MRVRREDRICETAFPRVKRHVSSATKPVLLPHLAHAKAPGWKLQTGAQTNVIFGQAAAADNRAGADTTSSVMTANLTNSATPKVVEIATSAASRPRAIAIRPIRGWLWRASNVYQRPSR